MQKELKIVQVKISDLNPALYNPRSWSEKAIQDLTQSIKKYGFVDPLIVNGSPNRKNIVIGGHFRLEIAKQLGYTEVPVVYIDIPDEEKEKELNLRLNKNTGEWDFEKLKSFDIDLLLDIGFDNSDLSQIWDDHLSVEDDNFDTEKELEKIQEPTTKLGDIYALGDHLLICADSTKICINVPGIKMVYSDSPYNINLDYNKGLGGAKQYGGKTQDNKSDAEFKQFLTEIVQNALASVEKDSHFFYYCDQKYIGLLQQIYQEQGIDHKRVCLWIKNGHNPTPQVAFNKAYEPCVYGTRGKPFLSSKLHNLNEVFNKEVVSGNRLTDDILDLFDIWLAKRKAMNEYTHPTEKPPTLHEKALRRCTQPGDLVLDQFGGSGSTLIACEQLKRRAILVEIEPVFCDLIIKRYEQFTGKKARKLN